MVIEVNPIEELIDLQTVEKKDEIALPEDATSLTLLQAVYRSPDLPLATRLRAATAALPHEHPKLGVSVNVPWSDEWAERLERAITRSAQVLSAPPPPQIEHQPAPSAPEQSSISAPIGSVPDRRYRRG